MHTIAKKKRVKSFYPISPSFLRFTPLKNAPRFFLLNKIDYRHKNFNFSKFSLKNVTESSFLTQFPTPFHSNFGLGEERR